MLKIIVSAGVSAAALFVLTGCPDREVVRVDRPVVVERRTEVVRPVVRQPEVIVEERR